MVVVRVLVVVACVGDVITREMSLATPVSPLLLMLGGAWVVAAAGSSPSRTATHSRAPPQTLAHRRAPPRTANLLPSFRVRRAQNSAFIYTLVYPDLGTDSLLEKRLRTAVCAKPRAYIYERPP